VILAGAGLAVAEKAFFFGAVTRASVVVVLGSVFDCNMDGEHADLVRATCFLVFLLLESFALGMPRFCCADSSDDGSTRYP